MAFFKDLEIQFKSKNRKFYEPDLSINKRGNFHA